MKMMHLKVGSKLIQFNSLDFWREALESVIMKRGALTKQLDSERAISCWEQSIDQSINQWDSELAGDKLMSACSRLRLPVDTLLKHSRGK
jgi:hypothetical protein